MRFYWLVLGILAVWRITHLLEAEDGPWDMLARFRLWVGNGSWGRLFDCFYCLSIWIALPFALSLGETLKEKMLLWPAISGGAALLQRATGRIPPPAHYWEDDDDLLRRQEGGGGDGDSGTVGGAG